MKWIAWVSWKDSAGTIREKEKEYDQEKRPDKTRVILDLVPRDCTTLGISIRKVR